MREPEMGLQASTAQFQITVWAKAAQRLPLLRPPPRPGPCPCFLHKLLLGMTAHLRRTILEDARTREWPDRSNSIQPRVLHSTQSSGQPAVECSGWLLGSSLTCCPIQLHRPSLAASVQICRSSPARQAAKRQPTWRWRCALCAVLPSAAYLTRGEG